MSKADYSENAILALIFNATTWTNMAINATSSPLTSLYVSLHTADPGEAGSQTTNEVGTGAYAGYTRIGVVRTSSGWTVSSSSVTNAAAITFPACTGGSGATITYFAIGTASSGTGNLLYSGALTSPSSLAVSTGITPSFAIGALTVTED